MRRCSNGESIIANPTDDLDHPDLYESDLEDDVRYQRDLDSDTIDLLQSQVHHDALPISIKHVMLTYLVDLRLPQRLADGRTQEVEVAARNAALVAVDPRYPRRDRIKQCWGDDEPIEPAVLTTTSVDQFYLTYKHFEGNDAQLDGLSERLAAYRAAALGLAELNWMEHLHEPINALVSLTAETITAQIPVPRGERVRRFERRGHPLGELTDQNGCRA